MPRLPKPADQRQGHRQRAQLQLTPDALPPTPPTLGPLGQAAWLRIWTAGRGVLHHVGAYSAVAQACANFENGTGPDPIELLTAR